MTAIEVHEPTGPSTLAVATPAYNIGELAMLSDRISKTAMVPTNLRGKPDEILAVLMYGVEVGLPPMSSLQMIDNIQGRPSLNAQGMRALILGAGHEFTITESTTEKAVAVARRKDETITVSCEYTIAEARQAGLTNKDTWKKGPADMLVARVTTRMARRKFADVVLGLGYEPHELNDGPRVSLGAIDVGGAPEPEPLTPDRVEQFILWAQDQGVTDIAAVVRAATEGRTSHPAECTTDDVIALRDAVLAAKTKDEAETPAIDGAVPYGAADPDVEPITDTLRRKLHALLRSKLDVTGDDRHPTVTDLLGRGDNPVTSINDLTVAEARQVIDQLAEMPDLPPAAETVEQPTLEGD